MNMWVFLIDDMMWNNMACHWSTLIIASASGFLANEGFV